MDYNGGEILHDNVLFHSFCFFLGYLLNIILVWITLINSKEKEKPITNIFKENVTKPNVYAYYESNQMHLSIKKIFKFFFICLIPLLIDLIENIINKIDRGGNDNDQLKYYYDDHSIIEYIIIFYYLNLITKFIISINIFHLLF